MNLQKLKSRAEAIRSDALICLSGPDILKLVTIAEAAKEVVEWSEHDTGISALAKALEGVV